MAVMDAAIANVALPTMSHDLVVSSAASTWVVIAYQVAIVMVLLPASALSERIGYHRLYLGGLALFVALSLGCALASNLPVLAACRFVQGLGAAAMMSVTGAQTRLIWPRALLGRGIGYNAVVVACAGSAAPPLAGLILSHASWPWLFLVNIPTGIMSLILVTRFGPRVAAVTASFDTFSAVLSALMFGGLFMAATEFIQGHSCAVVIVYSVVGLTAGAVLLPRMRSAIRPLIPIDLIAMKGVRPAYGASVCAFASLTCMLVYLPFVLQDQMRLDVAMVGLLMLPVTLATAISSPIAGRLSDRSWAPAMSALGLGLNAVSVAALALVIPGRPPLLLIAVAMALYGTGFGLFQSPNNNVMLRRPPIERIGAAGGMLATCRLVGQNVGALTAALALRLPELGPLSGLYFAAAFALLSAAFVRSRSQGD